MYTGQSQRGLAMYGAAAVRDGLGRIEPGCDPIAGDGGGDPAQVWDEIQGCWVTADPGGAGVDPAVLIPTVVNTQGPIVVDDGSTIVRQVVPVSVPIAPVSQLLPAPTAPTSSAVTALVIAAALWGTFVVAENLLKSHRRGR